MPILLRYPQRYYPRITSINAALYSLCKLEYRFLCVRIKGDASTTKRFLNALKLFTLAGSLGGCESLIEVPSLMSHQSVPPEQRAELGITETLMRVSIGELTVVRSDCKFNVI